MSQLCDSCGSDDEVTEVVRLYVRYDQASPDPDSPGAPAVTEGGTERWCFVCRTHYAHREASPSA